ncbi:hypothetical protein CEXT_227151 [Caerostris extrusa]|uniref:Uncharacterized protein n=1 Tax=Caerostris extrusa TaxID=172846 RepID=A0AAV4N9Q4_CAEEX|nr:hypothetical protein CEXT_227151 [Caerostris extrusa]
MPPPGFDPEACGTKGQRASQLATRPHKKEEEQVTPETISERSLEIPAYVPIPSSKSDSLIFLIRLLNCSQISFEPPTITYAFQQQPLRSAKNNYLSLRANKQQLMHGNNYYLWMTTQQHLCVPTATTTSYACQQLLMRANFKSNCLCEATTAYACQ